MEQTHIILLAETKESPNLGRPLRAQALRVYGIRETGDLAFALLHDAEGEDREVEGDDAAADRLSLALAGASWAVAGVALGEQEPDASGMHDTLLHREALLVVAAGDLEDVALELVADAVGGHLLAHPAVDEDAELALIVDVDQLLRPVRRV